MGDPTLKGETDEGKLRLAGSLQTDRWDFLVYF